MPQTSSVNLLAGLEALSLLVPTKQPVMLTFEHADSKHLCLIFIGSTVFISELQNFRAPGPTMSKMHSGRLAYWAINNLLYALQMLPK